MLSVSGEKGMGCSGKTYNAQIPAAKNDPPKMSIAPRVRNLDLNRPRFMKI